MRIFLTAGLFEVVVLAAALFVASAAAAEWVSGFEGMEQPGHDPCRDGRYSRGRAMNCDELLRQLDREEEERERRHRLGDPCHDGRHSTGRPMTCGELLDRLDRLDRRERRFRRRSGEAYGSGPVVEPVSGQYLVR